MNNIHLNNHMDESDYYHCPKCFYFLSTTRLTFKKTPRARQKEAGSQSLTVHQGTDSCPYWQDRPCRTRGPTGAKRPIKEGLKLPVIPVFGGSGTRAPVPNDMCFYHHPALSPRDLQGFFRCLWVSRTCCRLALSLLYRASSKSELNKY